MKPEFFPASDNSLLVRFEQRIAPEVSARVLDLFWRMLESGDARILNLHPAYASLLVRFDPLHTSHAETEQFVSECLEGATEATHRVGKAVEIPVCYGGEFGPDLEHVARNAELEPDEVISIHAGGEYAVYFLGFSPGFAYMGGMDARIATPRLGTPRKQVPAGSVGIADAQTGMYPVASPGGWQLIGRTPLALFTPHQQSITLLAPGDRVRFRAITRDEYDALAQEQPK